jgi:hypothetical protein
LPPQGEAAVSEDALASFIRYWNSMRQDGDVPLRTHIDPRGIETLLGNEFIAERVAPGFARLRIAGAHLAELMGMEVRGMPISTFIDPQDRDHLSDTLVELFERPATVRIDLAARGGLRRPDIMGTLLILPLRSDLGDISRALGCLVTSGAIDAVPRRFGITSVHCSPIDVTQPAPPVTSRTSPRHASERPWLKLVHST